MSNKYIYGIDFGTSTSVLSVLDKSTKNVIHTFSENSLIYFQDVAHHFIGKAAIRHYLSNDMKGRLLKSIKTLLPQPGFTFTYIFGKKYTAEDLVCLILKNLKEKADAQIGECVIEVVMGRPVVFSDDIVNDQLAEKRLVNAARKAGFEQIYLQYEPIAAGFLYEQTLEHPEMVLIGDVGGGTTDFTLMRLDRNNATAIDRQKDILKAGGLHTGGDDFDAAIMWHKLVKHFGYGLQYESNGKMLDLPAHIFRTLCEWEHMAFLKEGKIRKQLDHYYKYTNNAEAINSLRILIDENLGFALFQIIEQAKIDLSALQEVDLKFDKSGLSLFEHISLDDFNETIQKDIEDIEKFLAKFIHDSGVNPVEIQNIFLTGGASSVSAVQEIFSRLFVQAKIHRGDNFNSVAQGLALSYFYLQATEAKVGR